MGSLLIELLPFALGLVVTPAAITTVVLFLTSERPVANAVACALPFLLVYSGLAAVALVASAATTGPLISSRTKSVVSLVVGLVLLGLAATSLRRHHRRQGAPPRPNWMTRVGSATPGVAFGIGLALAVLNPNMPILLGGLAVVVAADISAAAQVVGAAFLVVVAQLGLTGLILWYVMSPERATRELRRLKTWLAAHEHVVDLAVLVVFGAAFTVKGLTGL